MDSNAYNQSQTNPHRAQDEDKQTSKPSGAGHVDERLLRKTGHQDQQDPPRSLSNLQGNERRTEDTNGTATNGSNITMDPPPLPLLPQTPAIFFAREGMMNELLDLAEQFTSLSLFGAGGLGKSSIALTLLHNDRIKIRFGRNRYFVRCDDLAGSPEGLLAILSDAIGTPRPTDVAQLRSHLGPSPLLLILDGADSVLDPLAIGAAETVATIGEIGRYQDVCFITTGRMDAEIPGFLPIEVPVLSEDGARDAFYSLCNLGRSSAVNDLIARLDFHPLSIHLLASAIHEKDWDEATSLKAWDDDKTNVLETCHHRCLKDVVESSLRSPSIQGLGTTVRDALEAIAVFPGGVRESRLNSMFPGISGIGDAVAMLCKFSLLYRKDGFVKMLSPFRFHFLESVQPVVYTTGRETIRIHIIDEATGGDITHNPATDEAARSDTVHGPVTDEDTPIIPCYPIMACSFSSFYLIAALK